MVIAADNTIPSCGKRLATAEGWIWIVGRREWLQRTEAGWDGYPCGMAYNMDNHERRCDRCMKKAGLIW